MPGNLFFTSLTIRCFKSENPRLYSFFKSQSTNNKIFLNNFKILLTCLQQHDQKIIIFSDFNISSLQNFKFVEKYCAIIAQIGFTQRLVFPT